MTRLQRIQDDVWTRVFTETYARERKAGGSVDHACACAHWEADEVAIEPLHLHKGEDE